VDTAAAAPRTLVVLRHAKSDYPVGVADHDRPLAPRGRRDTVAVGAWLAEHGGLISSAAALVRVSTARRAQETWALAAAAAGGAWASIPHLDEPRIYEARAATLARIAGEADDRVTTQVLVGHNPGLADLVELVGARGPMRDEVTARFPTSAVVVLTTTEPWAVATSLAGSFQVIEFAVPRAVRS
jgi:phosphohistidine phosphatase